MLWTFAHPKVGSGKVQFLNASGFWGSGVQIVTVPKVKLSADSWLASTYLDNLSTIKILNETHFTVNKNVVHSGLTVHVKFNRLHHFVSTNSQCTLKSNSPALTVGDT